MPSVSIRRPANRYVLLKCFKAVIKEFSGEAQQISSSFLKWAMDIAPTVLCNANAVDL